MSGYKNEIQQLCTGEPDFAFEPLLGLRQWTVVAPDHPVADDSTPGHFSLRGHYNHMWQTGENVGTCRAPSQSSRVTLPFSHYGGSKTPKDLVEPIQTALRDVLSQAQRRSEEDPEFLVDVADAQLTVTLNNITVISDRSVDELRDFIFDAKQVPDTLRHGIQRALETLEDSTPGVHLDRRPFSYLSDFSRGMRGWAATSTSVLPVSQLRVSATLDGERRPHPPAYPACTCGFYAYTDVDSLRDNSTAYSYSVFGLIQGYGTVTLGARGFRAEKARIVALTVPQTGEVEFVDTPWMLNQTTGQVMAALAGMHRWRSNDEPVTYVPAHSDFELGYKALGDLTQDLYIVEDIDALVLHAAAAYGVDLA